MGSVRRGSIADSVVNANVSHIVDAPAPTEPYQEATDDVVSIYLIVRLRSTGTWLVPGRLKD